ncbi:helix-turn-helix transcriptional regulator [Patescibacteria group bacterium]|nr:helix-turn-helix transcriptional regulator [Patescibacteria group bacterium]MCG2701822.1 helix-turn-helix transcriptional regulator [Candidatus Parcubacteria bacterium]MBU4265229.1 helix-turn-helix transcriptional regulator [Patescibacteria group bacterium]MBU4390294.1 helix-turn-helix transcriptional regulator [Patescibacteria group bacterium]MBU4397069.1 helix-turn-helix transcriptional regulator [Patescibacteria group bacterium]
MLTKSEFTAEVGKGIKKWRIKRNVSQEELAHRAGLYRTYVGHLENFKYSPSAYVLYKIAKALKVQISDFFPET